MNLIENILWIPVRDRLPDPEITVLIFHPSADEPVWLGYLDEDDDGHFWRWADGRRVEAADAVTHWADLPAGPAVAKSRSRKGRKAGGASCPK